MLIRKRQSISIHQGQEALRNNMSNLNTLKNICTKECKPIEKKISFRVLDAPSQKPYHTNMTMFDLNKFLKNKLFRTMNIKIFNNLTLLSLKSFDLTHD